MHEASIAQNNYDNNYAFFVCNSEPISVIGLSLNDTCLKEGSSISIRCNIRGFPRPGIEFRKNDIEITPEIGMFQNILLEFYDQVRDLMIQSLIIFHSIPPCLDMYVWQ